jgi:hypothetical protein
MEKCCDIINSVYFGAGMLLRRIIWTINHSLNVSRGRHVHAGPVKSPVQGGALIKSCF